MYLSEDGEPQPKWYAKSQVNDVELAMAKKLFTFMVKPYEPEQYKDEYPSAPPGYDCQQIEGKEIISASTDEPP